MVVGYVGNIKLLIISGVVRQKGAGLIFLVVERKGFIGYNWVINWVLFGFN